jgi:hypothetical protein
MPELGLVDLADMTLEERLAGKLNEQLELFACRMRQGLLAASVAIGLEVMDELIEAEVTDAAGPKGRHDPDRSAYRHGTEAGKVTLGGRRVPVVRPRAADHRNSPLSITEIPQAMSGVEGLISAYATVKLAPPD